jgi:uncharacterized repeat protein (TIGR03803 family)
MCKRSLWKTIGLVGVFCAAAVIDSPAQTFKTLVNFNGVAGANPGYGSLVQGLDGNFYGTTQSGGANDNEICAGAILQQPPAQQAPAAAGSPVSVADIGCGTVFKITPGGTLTTLYSFCSKTGCTDGAVPEAGLVLATDGDFYGTTWQGGANQKGTVFKITPGGTLTTLYCFCSKTNCTDGSRPFGGLVQATNGSLYGTTYTGGADVTCVIYNYVGCGTVFRITPSGTLTTLHSFYATDGDGPIAALVQATDGNFYGTTLLNGFGTVFKVTPGGTLTTLHRFDGTDGAWPNAGLVQATEGNFYGTTVDGGAKIYPGTIFKITPAGTLTTLHSFCAQKDCTDGEFPRAELVQATDGNFYGTTESGGAMGDGTVFKITPGGTLTTLHSFSGTDGADPYAGLVQATDGSFYGTTYYGGANDGGTVFSLAVGLGPFVKTLPTSGEVGATVIILGTDLTGATSVTFDGTAAAFTVVSSSEITTTVPSGAATGEVRVTTPQGTLICNVNFRVTPTISDFSPTSGAVGTSVVITGEGFRGATCMSIGGVMATSFTLDSDTQITVTVPTGAKTGHIAVSTLGGTAVSAGTFTIN